MDFYENGTVKHQTPEEPSYFEIIPVDALCDFCFAVVEMLKNVQKSDEHFEEVVFLERITEIWVQTIKKDCLEHTTDSSKKEICGYVDKINLERLKKESPSKLCMEERLCFEQRPEHKVLRVFYRKAAAFRARKCQSSCRKMRNRRSSQIGSNHQKKHSQKTQKFR